MKSLPSFLIFSYLFVSACSSELTDVERYALDGRPIVMGNGVKMRPIGPVKFYNGPKLADTGVSHSALMEAIAKFQAQPTVMGARMIRNGIEYVTDENFQVDGIASDTEPGKATRPKNKPKSVKAKDSSLGEFGTISSALTDNRYPTPTETNNWPWSTSVEIQHTDGRPCSGSLIGPHTVVTAAHCFYQGGHWLETLFLAPGADDDTYGTYPFGSFWSWSLWFPGNYSTPGDGYDFAVVDLSGAGLNGEASWLGTSIQLLHTPGIPGLRSGYDNDKQDPNRSIPGIPNQWVSESAIVNACDYGQIGGPPPCNWVFHWMYATGGGSGSGLYLNYGPYAGKLVGVLTAEIDWGPLGGQMTATHWLNWTYNFVHAVDTHWP